MSDALYGVVAAGSLATIASLLALRDSRTMKQNHAHSSRPVTAFWATVAAYMFAFTLLRLAAAVGWTGPLDGLYVLQTLAGASTIVALTSIIAQALLRPWASGLATGIFMGLAAVSVLLIFMGGYQGPIDSHWSIEFLPNLIAARIIVGAVYLLAPVVLAGLILYAAGNGSTQKRRLVLFSASVVLMYLPNASKYVWLVEGPWTLVQAIIMAIGAVVGWQSYRWAESPHDATMPGSSSNG